MIPNDVFTMKYQGRKQKFRCAAASDVITSNFVCSSWEDFNNADEYWQVDLYLRRLAACTKESMEATRFVPSNAIGEFVHYHSGRIYLEVL